MHKVLMQGKRQGGGIPLCSSQPQQELTAPREKGKKAVLTYL